MSSKVRSMCWKLPLPPTDKLVLLRYAEEADANGGGISVPVHVVADDCELSTRSVQYIVKKLLDLGVLLLVGNPSGGRGKARLYCIDLARCKALADEKRVQRVQTVKPDCGVSDDEERVQRVQTTQQAAPFEPSRIDISPTPETELAKRSEDARAVIRAFDDERAAAYGADQARPWPAGQDRVFAQRWLDAGADLDLCRDVFGGAMRRYAQTGRKPPDSLSYFDRAIADALATRSAPMPAGTPNDRKPQPDRDQRTYGSDGETGKRAILRAVGLEPGLEPGRAASG